MNKLRTLPLTSVFLLLVNVALAQKGTIRGTILDGASDIGEGLPFANIVLAGTTRGTTSDLDGKFVIKLDPGTYSLIISFVSYDDLKIENIEVKASSVLNMDVTLKESRDIQLKEIIVQAEAIRSTESTILSMQKKSINLMDGISAQLFRKIGDSDAASAIKRVPGVAIQEGKYIYVRGLGDRYTKTMLNGLDVPGLDPDKNTIQLDLFPTGILDNLIVLKSFTPDLPADFTGAVVNIETQDFPDDKILNVSGKISYNPDMHLNQDYLTMTSSSTDWLGFDDGSRSLPISKTLDILPVFSTTSSTDNYDVTKKFNPNLSAVNATSGLNGSFGLTSGNQYNKHWGEVSFIASLNYKSKTMFYDDEETNVYRRSSVDPNSYDLVIRQAQKGARGVKDVLLSGMIGGALKTDKSKLRLTLLHIQNGISQSGQYNRSQPFENNDLRYKEVLQYTQRSVSNLLISGKHIIGQHKWNVNWKIAPTFSKISDKDVRVTTFNNSSTRDNFIIDKSVSNPQRFFRELSEFNIASRIDISRPFQLLKQENKFKLGAMYVRKSRVFEIQNYFLEYSAKGERFSLDEPDPNVLMAKSNLYHPVNQPTGFYIYGSPQPQNEFDARQQNIAAYVMLESKLTKSLKTILGVRMEHFTHHYTGQDQSFTAFNDSLLIDQLQFYPSFSLIYELFKGFNIRASYSQTTARPSFKELSIAQIDDPISAVTFNGNVGLTTTNIHNFDIRLEYFMNQEQMISFSGFYKKLINPIEITRYKISPSNIQPVNVNSAVVGGIEFELRKNLSFISSSLKNLSINVNISLVESFVKIPDEEFEGKSNFLRPNETIERNRNLQGQSPFLVNTGLSYQTLDNKWQAGVFYNVQGEKIWIVGINDIPDAWEQPFHSLNANVSRTFGVTRQSVLQVGVNNILDDQWEFLYHSNNAADQLARKYSPGVLFSIRYSYSFF